MFSDDDFANKSLMKAPPSEKPPPPPPEESSNAAGPGKKGNAGGEGGDGDDDEIDQQERQIIASLEMEEREHNRYIMEQKMKRLPSNLSSNSSATINTGTLHYLINVALFLLIFAKISCATFISHAQLLFIFENFECATFIRLRYICIAA